MARRIAQPPKKSLCHQASIHPVTRPNRSSATRAIDNFPGWNLPPLVIRAIAAHRKILGFMHEPITSPSKPVKLIGFLPAVALGSPAGTRGPVLPEITYLSPGEIEARNRGYSPYSVETWRTWEYWANKAGCGHLLTRRPAESLIRQWAIYKPYRSPGFGASCQEGELRLRGRFRQEIVDAGALGDGSGSQAVVAGDHDGAQPHPAQQGDTDVDVRLERILQHDHPKRAVAVCHQERCRALYRRFQCPRHRPIASSEFMHALWRGCGFRLEN